MKKWIIAIVCILIVVCFGLLIYFNFDLIKSNSTLYTKEQMDEACKKAYNEAISNEQDYIFEINQLKTSNKDLTLQVELLEPLANENPTLKKQIEDLNKQINDQEKLIKAIEDKNIVYVYFYNADELFKVSIVVKGDKIRSVPEVNIRGYDFIGWSRESTSDEIFDVSSINYNENTNYYAVLREKQVNFNMTDLYSMKIYASRDGTYEINYKALNNADVRIIFMYGNQISHTDPILCVDASSNSQTSDYYKYFADELTFNNIQFNLQSGDISPFVELSVYIKSHYVYNQTELIDLFENNLVVCDYDIECFVEVIYR